MDIIAHIQTDFDEKFGIPRQSGLVDELTGEIVFEPEYRSADAVKGLEGFDYIWLLWQFQVPKSENWSATVKPPRLGGNTTMGVFATRSPFRPNNIGLSSVRLKEIRYSKNGPVLVVQGADLRNNTPIYDIKPYLSYTDSHPDARCGFARQTKNYCLKVVFPKELLEKLPKEKQAAVIKVLEQDPRPAYHCDEQRRYGMAFAGYDIRFKVKDGTLTVCEVVRPPLIPGI